MDEVKERLAGCFRVVFPDVEPSAIYTVSQAAVAEWDSVAAITLVNVIEEEFGVQLDFEALAELTSFPLVLEHVRTLNVPG